jgi:alanine-glyoxylate transaminase/(R)-3-amino-2-methylpropionate-pyruvate transaminase
VSSEAAPEQALPRPPPEMPPFDHRPTPYAGMGGDEILEKRKKFLGPSLFYYYQKPVRICEPVSVLFASSWRLRFCV